MLEILVLACLTVPLDPPTTAQPATASSGGRLSTIHWADVDQDGLDDAFVLAPGSAGLLLRNQGDGTFEDVTAESGLGGLESPTLAAFADQDDDRWPDLFVATPRGARLFKNQGGLSFADVTLASGLALGERVLHADWLDYDRDGLADLHLLTEACDHLYRNLGAGLFEPVDLHLCDASATRVTGAMNGASAIDAGSVAADPLALDPGAAPGPDHAGAIRTSPHAPNATLGSGEVDGALRGTSSSGSQYIGGGSSHTSGPPPLICSDALVDQATSACGLQASTTPVLGMLYPLSTALNVDSSGKVGMGTTSPAHRLHVIETTATGIFGQGGTTGVRGDANLVGAGNRIGGEFTASGGSNNIGVRGTSSIGVFGIGSAYGVYGESNSGSAVGVYGKTNHVSATTTGVLGEAVSPAGTAVEGVHLATSGTSAGVKGRTLSSTNGAAGVRGEASATSGNTIGVYGESASPTGVAVTGLASATSGANVGMHGESLSSIGIGVRGRAYASSGATLGVFGEVSSTDGIGVWGAAYASSGSPIGVSGSSNSNSGIGVKGQNSSTFGTAVLGESDWIGTGVEGRGGLGVLGQGQTAGNPVGVVGQTGNPNTYPAGRGTGVFGAVELPPTGGGSCIGVWGVAKSEFGGPTSCIGTGVIGSTYSAVALSSGVYGSYDGSTNADIPGVQGISTPAPNWGIGGRFTGGYIGVDASATASGTGERYGGKFEASGGTLFQFGVWARADDPQDNGDARAVFGTVPSAADGYAGYFAGNVHVAGTLSKSAGAFVIDHPLDPANRTLTHSFVESPDMKNIYDGLVTLDSRGEAWVEMPAWFEALNRDFRYQLTAVGARAELWVSHELLGNRFQISGDLPGLKVSWQVTGIRKDAYAEKNRLVVEQWKRPEDRGLYMNPESFGVPAEMGMEAARQARADEVKERERGKTVVNPHVLPLQSAPERFNARREPAGVAEPSGPESEHPRAGARPVPVEQPSRPSKP